MLSINDFIEKSEGKAEIYRNLKAELDENVSDKLAISIPDMHLLTKGSDDDFFDGDEKNIERFESLLYFLQDLKGEIKVIQLGDMFELWQARGNTNPIYKAYTNILGLLDKTLEPTYIIGNHDIDLFKWYRDQGWTFNRNWRSFLEMDGRKKVIFEHGFQADFFNNQGTWAGAIGQGITRIVGYMEYLHPDIDVILGDVWDELKRVFSIYNAGLTARQNPDFAEHEYYNYYINLMEKYNKGESDDIEEPTQLRLAVIAHTHRARLVTKPRDHKKYYLMDCGSWVNGGHEIGLISGKEIAICQWKLLNLE